MNWLLLGKTISISAQRKWSEPTDRNWFKFELAPATAGMLEVSQGDGDLTVGEPIYTHTDRSPIALYLPTPSLITPQTKRLALQSEQRLKVRIYILDVEPILTVSSSSTAMSSNPTTIESTTESVTLLESNFSRKGATLYNSSNATLFIDFDNVATITSCAVAIPPMGYYEIPFNIQTKITGIWSAVSGSALVRELT